MLQFALLLLATGQSGSPDLVTKPYLQLGVDRSVVAMWHARPASSGWKIRVGAKDFAVASRRTVKAPGVPAHDVVRAPLAGLAPGVRHRFDLVQHDKVVYGGYVTPPAPPSTTTVHFALAGDIGRGTPGQRKVAYEIFRSRPDFLVMLGDIVYPHGRMNEYPKYLYPIWANDVASPTTGAPLLSNLLSIPVAGNHDTTYRNLKTYPDGLAFYAYWQTPADGPEMKLDIKGSPERERALEEFSGGEMRRMANYTFSFGNTSWVVLDSNYYVDWTKPALRQWLDGALSRARKSKWSFVAMHVPPYSSSKAHAGDTITRNLTSLFEKHGVDIVFAGHIHNYQRTHPMKGKEMDKAFNGTTSTSPQGTIYIISGAGGAELYDQAQADRPETWQPFTAKFKAGYSFTDVTVEGSTLTLRQVSADGKEIDRATISKQP